MVSRKNTKLLTQNQADTKQRYTIKKLSIGAASVLLGTTLMFGSGLTANADETSSSDTTEDNTNISTADDVVGTTTNTGVTYTSDEVPTNNESAQSNETTDATTEADDTTAQSVDSTQASEVLTNDTTTSTVQNIDSNQTSEVSTNDTTAQNEVTPASEESTNESSVTTDTSTNEQATTNDVSGTSDSTVTTLNDNASTVDPTTYVPASYDDYLTAEDKALNNEEQQQDLLSYKKGQQIDLGGTFSIKINDNVYTADGIAEYNNGEDTIGNAGSSFAGFDPVLYVYKDGQYVKDEDFSEFIKNNVYMELEYASSTWRTPESNIYLTYSNIGQIDEYSPKTITFYTQVGENTERTINGITAQTYVDLLNGLSNVKFTFSEDMLNVKPVYDEDGNITDYESLLTKYNTDGLTYKLRTNQVIFSNNILQSNLEMYEAEQNGTTYLGNDSVLKVDGKQAKISYPIYKDETSPEYTPGDIAHVELALYLDAYQQVTENKTVTRTINYVYDNGTQASEPTTQEVTFTRTGTKNLGTGETTWGDWTEAQTFASVISPTIENYTADKESIASTTVTADSNDIVETVTYSPKMETVTETNTRSRLIQYKSETTEMLIAPNNDTVVTFTRTGTKNLATGEITWGEWDDGNGNSEVTLPEVVAPVIDGYVNITQSVSPEYTIHGSDTIDEHNIIYYSPTSTINVSFVDDTTGQTLDTLSQTDIIGSDSTLDVQSKLQSYLDAGYEVVSNDYPGNATLPIDDYPGAVANYSIHLKQVSETTEEPVTYTRIIDFRKFNYDGTRYTEAFPQVTQKVTGTKTTVTNKVTGESTVTYTWNESQFDEVEAPELQGYHVQVGQGDIPALSTTGLESRDGYTDNGVEYGVVDYIPNNQAIIINFIIDDVYDENGNPLTSTQSFAGFTDQTLSDTDKAFLDGIIKSYQEMPLEQVSSDLPNELVYDDSSNDADGKDKSPQIYNIHYRTKSEQVSENKTVTNTITYVDEQGNQLFDTVNQELTFTHTGIHNLFTDETTWNDWTPEQTFESVTSPEKNGYTANIKVVENVTVNHESPNQQTVVVYTPDTQKIIVNYIDKTTGQTLKSDNVDGATNTDSGYTTNDQINAYEEAGYVLESDETKGQSLIFDDDTNTDQVYNVYLTHKQETKTETSTINRVIHYVDKNGNTVFDDHVDTPITFTRDGVYDYVTNETTWNAWTTDNDTFESVTSPEKTGYTASQTTVPAQQVTPESSNIEETVVYAPNKQHMIINYIDDVTGQTLKTDTVDGETDQKSDYSTAKSIAEYESQNYELVSDDTAGKDLIFDDTTPVYNVHLTHKTEQSTESVTLSDKWNFVYEDGSKAFDSTNEEYTVTRDVTTDLVTGEKTYGEPTVTQVTFNGFDVPTIAGYTATLNGQSIDKVTNETVQVDFNNPVHRENTIIYQTDIQNIVINFIDSTTGQTLETKTFTGQTNSQLDYVTKDDIAKYVANHYEFVSDETNGEVVSFDNDTNTDQVYTVVFKHQTENVNESHDVKRTINYVYANGTQAFESIVQGPIEFTRDGIKDLVTGETTWNDWNSNQQFNSVVSPEKAGYSADIQTVDAMTVTPETKDTEVTVVYHPTLQSFVVEYIDDVTGEIIHRDSDTGLTGDKSNYSTTNKISELTNQGYDLVSDGYSEVTFSPDMNGQVYQVHFTHGTEDVTESKTITRVITFVDEDGNELASPETQTVDLTRTGTKDKVTGEITWDNPTGEFAEVSKDIDGYHTDEKAPQTNVTYDSENQEVVIHYVKDEVPTIPEEPSVTPDEPDTTPETPSETPNEPDLIPEEPQENETSNIPVTPEAKVLTPQQTVIVPTSETTNNQVTQPTIQKSQATVQKTSDTELPQTGEEHNNLAAIGVTLLGMLGLAGIAKKKRKED